MAVMTGAGMLVGGADLVIKMTPSLSAHPPMVHALTVRLYLSRDASYQLKSLLLIFEGWGKWGWRGVRDVCSFNDIIYLYIFCERMSSRGYHYGENAC